MEEFLSPEENNKYVDVSNIVGLSTVKDNEERRRNAAGAGRGNGQAELEQRRRDAEAAEAAAAAEEERQRAARAAAAAAMATKIGPIKWQGEPRPNPLRDYANYIYNLSFHVIPPEKYNKLATEPGYEYINDDQTVLIASAGRRDEKVFQRHPKFKEDFYFETLKMTTVVGMNSRSRHSNAIDINFTLIEPYGFTLINRLLAVADQLKTKSWMQIPFMLQIDFMGNNDLGDPLNPIPNQSKYLPVKLIGCKSKVTQRGAEYQLQCVPFNHQAFTDTAVSTPAMFEVTATTIKDFFSTSGSAGEAENIMRVKNAGKERQEQIAREIENEKKKDPKSPRIAELAKESNALSKDISATGYRVSSYAAALNSYQRQLKQNNHIKVTEDIKFEFDPEFADSKIVFPKKTASTKTPMLTLKTPGGIAAIRAQAGLPAGGTDTTTEVFNINAGTSILDVISMSMKNSEFIRNQFKDPAVEPSDPQKAADELGKPIIWFKIVPVLKLKDFDAKRDVYAKEITYHVKKYVHYNTKFRDAPKAQPSYSCKEYHYMYTGKNEDILSFDIDFDIMFYTSITADRAKTQRDRTQTQDPQSNKDNAPPEPQSVTVANNVTQPVSGQADQVNPVSVDSKATLVNDFSKSMMSSSRGDMINVKLKIIGDPELIKQDDVFKNPANNPGNPEASTSPIDPKTNSVLFDFTEIFALLTFRTPVDWNPVNGEMKFEDTEYSVFSGVYKIITVENEFTRGQFTQSLDMVRLFDQPAWDSLQSSRIKTKTNDPRAENLETIADLENEAGDDTDEEELVLLGGPEDDSEEGSDEPELLGGPDNEEPVDEFGDLDGAIAAQERDNLGEFAGLDAAIARQREYENLGEFAGIDQAIAQQQLRLKADLAAAPEGRPDPGF